MKPKSFNPNNKSSKFPQLYNPPSCFKPINSNTSLNNVLITAPGLAKSTTTTTMMTITTLNTGIASRRSHEQLGYSPLLHGDQHQEQEAMLPWIDRYRQRYSHNKSDNNNKFRSRGNSANSMRLVNPSKQDSEKKTEKHYSKTEAYNDIETTYQRDSVKTPQESLIGQYIEKKDILNLPLDFSRLNDTDDDIHLHDNNTNNNNSKDLFHANNTINNNHQVDQPNHRIDQLNHRVDQPNHRFDQNLERYFLNVMRKSSNSNHNNHYYAPINQTRLILKSFYEKGKLKSNSQVSSGTIELIGEDCHQSRNMKIKRANLPFKKKILTKGELHILNNNQTLSKEKNLLMKISHSTPSIIPNPNASLNHLLSQSICHSKIPTRNLTTPFCENKITT